MLDDQIVEGAPEDLILNDQFNNLFKDSKLKFDKVKGDFRMKREQTRALGLIGTGVHYNWTKKLLSDLVLLLKRTVKKNLMLRLN